MFSSHSLVSVILLAPTLIHCKQRQGMGGRARGSAVGRRNEKQGPVTASGRGKGGQLLHGENEGVLKGEDERKTVFGPEFSLRSLARSCACVPGSFHG